MAIVRPTPFKAEKLSEMIHHLSAKFVQNESSGASLITVTRVLLSKKKKSITIFFTTLPESKEDTALVFLKRKISDLKLFIRENSRIGIIPTLRFEIDKGERNRQNIDKLLSENN